MLPFGLTTHAVVSKIIDGDTIEIAVTNKIRVRMLNLWCPEMKTVEGKAAKEHLNSIIPVGTDIVVHIPCNKNGDLSPLFTLSRILGLIYKNGEDISEAMVAAGHGKAKKNIINFLKSEGFDYEKLRSIISNNRPTIAD